MGRQTPELRPAPVTSDRRGRGRASNELARPRKPRARVGDQPFTATAAAEPRRSATRAGREYLSKACPALNLQRPGRDTLSGGRGSCSCPTPQRMVPACREILGSRSSMAGTDRLARRRQRSRVSANARQCPNVYPSRTREAEGMPPQATRQPHLQGFCLKPSDGLEPSTPSLPFRFRGGTSGHARVCEGTKAAQTEGI